MALVVFGKEIPTNADSCQIIIDASELIVFGTSYWKKAKNYYVSFSGNGSTSGSMTKQTFTLGVAQALTVNAFVRTYYIFLGWNTSSAATTAQYTDKQSVTDLTTAADSTVNLYAVWKLNAYYVSFVGNSSTSGTMTNQTITLGVATALTSNTFARTSCTFMGWSISSSSSTISYSNGQSVTNLTTTAGATVNLYAVWKFWIFNGGVQNNISWSGYETLGTSIYVKKQTGTKTDSTMQYSTAYTSAINFTGFNTLIVNLTWSTYLSYISTSEGKIQIGSSTSSLSDSYSNTFVSNTGSGSSSITLTINVSSITNSKIISFVAGVKNTSTGSTPLMEIWVNSMYLV